MYLSYVHIYKVQRSLLDEAGTNTGLGTGALITRKIGPIVSA
jgi:hypothetical protein